MSKDVEKILNVTARWATPILIGLVAYFYAMDRSSIKDSNIKVVDELRQINTQINNFKLEYSLKLQDHEFRITNNENKLKNKDDERL